MVTSLVQNVVRISSNLLNDRTLTVWADLRTVGGGFGGISIGGTGVRANRRDNPGEIGRAVTALMIGVEENAFLLADAVTSEKIIIKPTQNIRKCILSSGSCKIFNFHKYDQPL